MSAYHCDGADGRRASREIWQTGGGRQLLSAPFLVAGIVNITPDSFSDGGCFATAEAASQRARSVVEQGAGMVDLGAESTRPGAEDIGHAEEWRRLQPVLQELLDWREEQRRNTFSAASAAALEAPGPGAFSVAVDTWRAATAVKVLELRPKLGADAGAEVINDVSGGSFDPALPEALAQFKPGYVLGHSPARPAVMQQAPRYDNVVEELLAWFSCRMNALVRAGLPETCIALDPCIGFGKTLEHTLEIIAAIPRFLALGRPLYFGISRKSFLGAIAGRPVHERDSATLAATVLLARAGVRIHRVHQVSGAVDALKVAAALAPGACRGQSV